MQILYTDKPAGVSVRLTSAAASLCLRMSDSPSTATGLSVQRALIEDSQLGYAGNEDSSSGGHPARSLCALPDGWTDCMRNVLDRVRGRFPLVWVLAAASFIVITCLAAWIVVVHRRITDLQMLKVCAQSSAAKDGKEDAVLPSCGDDWIWYQHKCFYISDDAGDWSEAKDLCAALDSSLAMIDTQKELDFLLRHKRDPDLWIGLRRGDLNQPWIWVDGTEFNHWFTVEDYAECAYLNHGIVKSSECYSKRQWVCSKYPYMKES